MPSVEEFVKQQFAKIFKQSDWRLFKRMAEYYLKRVAFLRKNDLGAPTDLRLLIRNSQKRLFIGIGVELLLKALYLKGGYVINEPEGGGSTLKFPFRFDEIGASPLKADHTYMLGRLIESIGKVIQINASDSQIVLKGLKIAKVFRNKEGHIVTSQHAFDASNYTDIESALTGLYKFAFAEILAVQFSVASSEQPLFKLSFPS